MPFTDLPEGTTHCDLCPMCKHSAKDGYCDYFEDVMGFTCECTAFEDKDTKKNN